MDNFNNKIKFIIGKQTLEKIPFELAKNNCTHAVIYIEKRKDIKKIRKVIKKILKNTGLSIEFCCIENLTENEDNTFLIYSYINKHKNKGIIVIGSGKFTSKINTIKMMIEQGVQNCFNLTFEPNCIIPIIIIPYDKTDKYFATKNIIFKTDKTNFVKCNCLENVTVISDERLLNKNLKKISIDVTEYKSDIFKALAATVNNTNILAMPVNKAIITNIIDNLIKISYNELIKDFYIKAEESKLLFALGEETYSFNGLTQMVELLSNNAKEYDILFINAAKQYLNYYKENEIFNYLLEIIIKKYKLKCGDDDKFEVFCEFIDAICDNVTVNCDTKMLILNKQDVNLAYNYIMQECCSNKITLDNAYKALINICTDSTN